MKLYKYDILNNRYLCNHEKYDIENNNYNKIVNIEMNKKKYSILDVKTVNLINSYYYDTKINTTEEIT